MGITVSIILAIALLVLQIAWVRRARALNARIRRLEQQVVQPAPSQPLTPFGFDPDHRRAIFDSMVEGVMFLNLDGRVQWINFSLKNLLGIHGDPCGRSIMETIRSHELREIVKKASLEGQAFGAEITPPGLDNRCLQVNATLLKNSQGQASGTMLVFHDLTHFKQIEESRKEFVANVSHELRTPLSLVKGYVETLLNGAKDDPAVATQFLQIILKHSDRLTFLIEDLLTLSRLESGKVVLQIQSAELRSLVSRILEDLTARAAERSVKLVNQVPETIVIKADIDRLQQVVVNLVENGIKYGTEGGTLIVGARLLEDHSVEIRVQDDGPGIPPEAQNRIFERFYRLDRARSRDQGGTGLGLAIVKHIVQSHGGRVWVESQPGKGATFLFSLPAEPAFYSGPTPAIP